MKSRADIAEELFLDGYNCAQAVFAAFSEQYDIDMETALRLSSSFGGGIGRLREVCGAVSGMCMVAGLETGSAKPGDTEGKKYNYEVVQSLCEEFKKTNHTLICRELLGLEPVQTNDTTPQTRDSKYYNTRPCEQLVRDAAEIIEKTLYRVNIIPVRGDKQIEDIAAIAEEIWLEHYAPIIGEAQVAYMIENFQSYQAMKEQINQKGYQYYHLETLGGLAGYFAVQEEKGALFLSKLYIAKKFRGRGYAKRTLEYILQLCKNKGLNRIWLTVNKNNTTSIHIYESLGFEKTGSQVADIGSGYVMDDYIMEMLPDFTS